MKIIRLTHPTGSDIWVTPKRIAWMEEGKYMGETATKVDFDYGGIFVRETPEEIIEAIKAAEEL